MLKVVIHDQAARLPSKGTTHAIGYDLSSCVELTIPARGKAIVTTGISIELPEGCYGRIAPRSGLAAKHGLDVGAGVIDADYRGVIQVILFNHSDEKYTIRVGDRIAQLILEQALCHVQVQQVDALSETVRAEGGFGSTGQ
jgi:dUTP pyrophosphatase